MWKNIIRNIAGFDISYDEFKDFCREAQKDGVHKDLYVDTSDKDKEEKYNTRKEATWEKFTECLPGTNISTEFEKVRYNK